MCAGAFMWTEGRIHVFLCVYVNREFVCFVTRMRPHEGGFMCVYPWANCYVYWCESTSWRVFLYTFVGFCAFMAPFVTRCVPPQPLGFRAASSKGNKRRRVTREVLSTLRVCRKRAP